MANTLLVAGTASHVGKSTVVAGLCRALADRGRAVAPYKAQNMSNNARVVPAPDGDPGEVGVSQYVQARAARVAPTTDHNPVLLKPRGDRESQLVVDGRAVTHVDTDDYYRDYWSRAREAAVAAHELLADAHDVVVAEGAGSIAEINLHDRDLANLETARVADADVLVLVDIERGGAFASLYGTLELLPADVRERVVGAAITKFRGDPALLEPGIEEIEARTGVPVLAVLPYDDPGLPAEDSVSLPAADESAVRGADDGVPDARRVTVAAVRLPRISNATDLEPLAAVPGVRVRYVPPTGRIADADAVVLPGTKNTVDDLRALRDAGFGDRLRAFDGPVVGLCGGYQLLGAALTNAGVESTDDVERLPGFGVLPVITAFCTEKHLERVSLDVVDADPIAGATGTATGYEIHMGRTELTDRGAARADVTHPLGPRSVATSDALGTYLHGVFENATVRDAFVDGLYERAGVPRPSPPADRDSPADRAAALVSDAGLVDALRDATDLGV
ncbi:cobyric acid synthase [Halarchaeum rubridurum]|uniref:Probable cobyric acid synthase n=1 Tax=Halarchaeum rubridurum TaxID=489911 RepID=A0A830FYG6_9EURY|nr:cobyric acid synthase [Halarchaeum rubridurum]GGM61420.1 cobyric acid synthase CobQ [Halarchaeum rubridurum]